jgi:hypothetical protein
MFSCVCSYRAGSVPHIYADIYTTQIERCLIIGKLFMPNPYKYTCIIYFLALRMHTQFLVGRFVGYY